ncbi:MAG TPA: hypothetical protein VGR57_00225 [Ktedonobacterales bacterium]|nr:hypothetical protein [Ktedonobacterales bacterium]
MNVHRLKLWLGRAAQSVRRAWRQYAGRSRTIQPPMRYSAHAPSSDLASARWLDDARRLRARPGARPRPTLTQVSREQLRQILTDPRWASAYDAALPPRPPRPPLLGEAHAPQPAGESTDSRPAVPSRPAAASEDQADRQRRLAFIRDLVRRGIYNEGFDAAHLPEQYRPHPDAPAE